MVRAVNEPHPAVACEKHVVFHGFGLARRMSIRRVMWLVVVVAKDARLSVL